MSTTWECWTLDSEEIEYAFTELYPGAMPITEDEVEVIARRFKDAVAVMLGDWEETLGDCIRIEIKRPESLSEEQVLRLRYPDVINYLDSGVFDEKDVVHIRTDEVILERIMETYQDWREVCSRSDAMYEAIKEEV